MERPAQGKQHTPRRRRRPAFSCQECRRRKVKCDHESPCEQCLRNNTPCVYKPFDEDGEAGSRSKDQRRTRLRQAHNTAGSRPTPASTPGRLQDATEGQTGEPEVGVPARESRQPEPSTRQPIVGTPAPHARTVPCPQGLSGLASIPSPLLARAPELGDAALGDVLARVRKLESLLSSRSEPGVAPTVTERPEVGLDSTLELRPQQPPFGSQAEWQTVLDKPRDWGKSRWLAKAPEFGPMIRCYGEIMGKDSKDPSFKTPETVAMIAQAAEFHQKCKAQAKRLKIGRPTRGAPSPGVGLAPLSREMADEFVRLYFASFESTHRILHPPTFWIEYQTYWDHTQCVSPELSLKVLLVMGIGSSLYDYQDAATAHNNTELLHQWIYAAETWLSGPLEKDRLDLGGLQIYCLSILARQIFSIGGDTVWMSMGSLVHRAMQLGLHRDPKHLPSMPVFQAELRRRLWATILDLAVQASLDARMPPRISLNEFDTEPPSNINDDEMHESTTSLQPKPKDTFTSTSLQLALLDSFPTRLRIVELLNGMHVEVTYHRVLTLTAELTSTLQTYATVFNKANNTNDRSTPFHRNYLDYLTRRFLIPLHYPFCHQARANPLFHQSVKISVDAALALVSPEPDSKADEDPTTAIAATSTTTDNNDHNNDNNNPDSVPNNNDDLKNNTFARLTATGGGLFREGFRCATTAVSLELLAHVATQRRDGSLRRAGQYREFLKQAVHGLVVLAERRIRAGETNVKSHMFLCMILAEVEAVEKGAGDECVGVEVARAARDSLQFCEGLLKERGEGMLSMGETPGSGVGAARPGSVSGSGPGLGMAGGSPPDGGLFEFGFGGGGMGGLQDFGLEELGAEMDWDFVLSNGYSC